MKFHRNSFGDYVSGDVTIVGPRFTGKFIVTVRGEPRGQKPTLKEAKRVAITIEVK